MTLSYQLFSLDIKGILICTKVGLSSVRLSVTFLANLSTPKPGNISCDLNPKVKGQILYFLVNASAPENNERSNFKLCRCIDHMM